MRVSTAFNRLLQIPGATVTEVVIGDGDIAPACGERCSLHDLARHTFAVMQLSAGTHFMQVSQWLGHATYTLTLDTYSDWIPQEHGGAANTLPEPPRPAQSAGSTTTSNVVPLRQHAN